MLAAYTPSWGPLFGVPGGIPAADGLPLGQAGQQVRLTVLTPLLLLQRTEVHRLDCRRRCSNRRRSCRYTLAAYTPSWGPHFGVPGGIPAADGLPLGQARQQLRLTVLTPLLLLERTDVHRLDCRRGCSSRRRSCRYTLAVYRPS
jgi:hypothetical protein